MQMYLPGETIDSEKALSAIDVLYMQTKLDPKLFKKEIKDTKYKIGLSKLDNSVSIRS